MRWKILALTILMWPTLAAGQSGDAGWNNLSRLRVGEKIEVIDTNLKSYKGTFLAFSGDAVSLRDNRQDVGVPRATVLRVTSRESSRRGRNALIGAAIGAAAGLAIGAAKDARLREEGEHIFKTGLTPIGAGIGAAVGAAIASYPTIYRAPK